MNEEIRIFIEGMPAPGGSKNAFPIYRGKKGSKVFTGKVAMVDAGGKGNEAWKKAVNLQAFNQFKQAPWEGPIAVEFHFIMSRPLYHYGTGKNAHRLKDNAPTFHVVKPDLTKLVRSTEDALSGRLWVDDAQICRQTTSKRYYGSKLGCVVVMRKLFHDVGDGGDFFAPANSGPV